MDRFDLLYCRKHADCEWTCRIVGNRLEQTTKWLGTGVTLVKTFPLPELSHLTPALRVDVERGTMPKLDEDNRWYANFGKWEHATYLDAPHHSKTTPMGTRKETGPCLLDTDEAQALIAYFLIPPPMEALTPGALDAIRTGTLDPEGFYELAIPTTPPNEFCRTEAFGWTMGLVLQRFRSHYV